MNSQRLIIAFLCIILCGHSFAQTNDIDTALSDLAEKLATQVQDHGKKKVAVIDFTDLEGSSSGELGKYIAEELNVDLVMGKRDFSVLDRANLKSILAEHKLTATGLVDPDNAKKLGQFAGVDALIMGTITPKGQNISLTAKIVTTDTAEIVGAARGGFKVDDTVTQLTSKPSTESGGGGDTSNLTFNPALVKSFGDLRVEVQSLQVVNGGKQYLLTLTLVNKSPKKSIWVAFNSTGMSGNMHGIIRDSNGYEFLMDSSGGSGLVCATVVKGGAFFGNAAPAPDRFNQATEVKPGDSISATAKFFSEQNRSATTGDCGVQLEFLLGKDFNNGVGDCTTQLFSGKINAQ